MIGRFVSLLKHIRIRFDMIVDSEEWIVVSEKRGVTGLRLAK
jgi:hypothetical protein